MIIESVKRRKSGHISISYIEDGKSFNVSLTPHDIVENYLAAQPHVQADLLPCGHTKSASWDDNRGVCVACEVTASQ